MAVIPNETVHLVYRPAPGITNHEIVETGTTDGSGLYTFADKAINTEYTIFVIAGSPNTAGYIDEAVDIVKARYDVELDDITDYFSITNHAENLAVTVYGYINFSVTLTGNVFISPATPVSGRSVYVCTDPTGNQYPVVDVATTDVNGDYSFNPVFIACGANAYMFAVTGALNDNSVVDTDVDTVTNVGTVTFQVTAEDQVTTADIEVSA